MIGVCVCIAIISALVFCAIVADLYDGGSKP